MPVGIQNVGTIDVVQMPPFRTRQEMAMLRSHDTDDINSSLYAHRHPVAGVIISMKELMQHRGTAWDCGCCSVERAGSKPEHSRQESHT